MILLSIDVTKIDKARLKEFKRRDGSSGKSLELVLIESKSEYGDYMVKQGITKEEREARLEMPILGNGKIVGGQQSSSGRSRPERKDPPPPGVPDDSGKYDARRGRDVPF